MKKFILTFGFLLAIIFAKAQSYGYNDHTVTIGLTGGSNIAFLQVQSPHREDISTGSESPFSIGLNADFKFNDYLSLRPGVFYTGKGGTINAGYADNFGNNTAVNDEYKLHYIEFQFDIIGHLPVGDGANIFLGAGPYYSQGLSGTNIQTLFSYNPVAYKITYGKNGDFKTVDAGATGVFGFQGASGWSISGNLDLGLTNILQTNNSGFDATQLKTTTFYLSVGQSF